MNISVTTLLDQSANIDLLNRLTVWLDENIDVMPDAIFAPDVIVRTPGGEAKGLDGAVAQARRTHNSSEINQHLTTNPIVEVDVDTARLRSNFIVAFGPPDMIAPARSMGGIYKLQTVRTASGWQIQELEITPRWRSGDWSQ